MEQIKNKEEIKLGYQERDTLYQKEYTALKIKITLNHFELVAFFLVAFLGLFFLINAVLEGFATPLITSLVISFVTVYIFHKIKNHQLTITRFDKEDIYKKVSDDLFEAKRAV